MASGWVNGEFRVEVIGGSDKPGGSSGTGGNAGNGGTIPGANTSLYPSTLGFPPVNDAAWFNRVPKWDTVNLGAGKSAKGVPSTIYIVRVENYVYRVFIDASGKAVQVDYVNWVRDQENRATDHMQQTPFRTRENKAISLAVDVNSVVGQVADFYKEITAKYSDKLSKQAQELAEKAKGKRIRSASDAIRAFDKYKDGVNAKFNAQDRAAIARALDSVNRDAMARSLATYSKGFGIVSYAINGLDLLEEFNKSVKSGNWGPFLVKAETIAAGMVASELVAFTFAAMTATSIGIVGFGILMMLVAALIDEEMVGKLNSTVLELMK